MRERRGLTVAEEHPHEAAAFDDGVTPGLDLGRERLGVRAVRRGVDDLAGHVDLPTVEDARERAVLVARQHQRRVAVRTPLVEEPDPTVRVAEGDVVRAHEAHAPGAPSTSSCAESSAGIQQCSRMSCPIGASPSMRVSASFCSCVSIRPPTVDRFHRSYRGSDPLVPSTLGSALPGDVRSRTLPMSSGVPELAVAAAIVAPLAAFDLEPARAVERDRRGVVRPHLERDLVGALRRRPLDARVEQARGPHP